MVTQKNSTLKGFERASTKKIHRLIASIVGDWKKGKTTFALTAPAPIALIDMDTGLEGVVEKWAKEKEIWVKTFDYHEAKDQDEWLEIWEDSKKAFTDALDDPKIRTVIIDTATEWYELIRMARFGKLNKVILEKGEARPYPWGPVNQEFRELLRKSLKTNKNVLFLHKTKAEYEDNEKTGRRIRAGFGDMEFIIQLNATCYRDGEKGFYLVINDCRQNADVMGLELAEPLNTFPNLGMLVFPETSEEEWV